MRFNQSYLQWRLNRMRKRLVCRMSARLYRDQHHDTARSILIAGTGRSGTTWLADIIASQLPARIMFEPFRSDKVEAFRQFHYFQYMRPSDQDEALSAYCRSVFSGSIRDAWIDWQVDRIFPEYRIIKEVRASLFLKWIHTNFPEVPLLFVVRHPCAVVLSRMELDWAARGDIEPMLAQNDLIEDFLSDKLDIIERAQTVEEQHAVIWCIHHLVPISQFQPQIGSTIFYENLCTQPRVEIPRIFQTIGQEYQDTVFRLVQRPSVTTRPTSAVVTGESQIKRWQERLSASQIDRILNIVRQFGLDYIYGDGLVPLVSTL